jgi:HAD superfamily hydrolase (TIGR01490 family)
VSDAVRLVLFDLDHTLLDGDSDVLWCDYLLRRGVLDRTSFEMRNRAMEAAYRQGSVSAQAFCEFYVSTLAGRSADQWAPLLDDFAAHVVNPRLLAKGRRLVRQHLDHGDLVVLTTATNRVLTGRTAAELGIEHLLATECEVDAEGRFTGRLDGTPNMRAGKVDRLHAWLAARGVALGDLHSTAYSDSINDLPLLQAVQHALVVDPDERLQAEAQAAGWPVLTLRD